MKRKNPYIREDERYSLFIYPCGKYELECYVFDQTPNSPFLYILNTETGSYNFAANFFLFGWGAELIKEELIPTIDEVVERNWGNEVLGNNIISAVIYPHITYFTSNNQLDEGIKKAQQNEREYLDTKTFRAISLLWLEFLESKLSQ